MLEQLDEEEIHLHEIMLQHSNEEKMLNDELDSLQKQFIGIPVLSSSTSVTAPHVTAPNSLLLSNRPAEVLVYCM